MNPGTILAVIVAALTAAGVTFGIIRLLARLRRRDAESDAREIIRRAEQEMENRRREVELEIKELAILQKAESERDLRVLREEIHERDRLLDKRQDGLEQQAEQLRKQEKIVEGTQRKLTEKIQEISHRKTS